MWAKFKDFLWEWRGVWITSPAIATVVILLRLAGLLQSWEWAAYDQYLRLRPPLPRDERIVIVGIDEADLRTIGSGYVPDLVYAQLLNKLKAQSPRAIGLDIYRDLPFEPGHQELVKVFQTTDNLVGIQKVVGNQQQEAVAPSPILKAKGQVGANDVITDADNKVRRGLLYLSDAQGETVYSFNLFLALLYLEKEGIEPEPVQGNKVWRLGKSIFRPLQANYGGYVGADARGYQILINYRGGAKSFAIVSLTDVLENRIPKDWGRDRLILVGVIGSSFNDLLFTPYSSGLLSIPEPMSGVELQANLISQILDAALIGRPLIQTWSEPIELVWILFWAGVGATLTWKLRYILDKKYLYSIQILAPFLVGMVLLGSTYAGMVNNWWLPVIPPFLALFGSTVAIATYIAFSAAFLRRTLGRYLTDEIVVTLLESPTGLELGGESRTITILTSDLRGFTALSERMSPQQTVKVVNLYFGYMADVIAKYQGTIDEFLGDGMLVLFGAPISREDDAVRAIACAIEMQLQMKEVNAAIEKWDLSPLEMGIGINTGEVVVGNIGSEQHTQYGVLGSQVNLTYRIESYTIGGQIYISETTKDLVGASRLRINGEKKVKPKGVQGEITIYDIGGISEPYNLFLPEVKEIFVPVLESIPLTYQILEGKDISEHIFQGNIIKLSERGAEIRVQDLVKDQVPAAFSNIKVNLLTSSEDIYAKVLDQKLAQGNFCIHFTFKPPVVAGYLFKALTQAIKANE